MKSPKHFEVAGGIVLRGNLVVVVSQQGTTWSFPKGHIETGETAKREVYEESGISDLEFIKKLGSYKRHSMDINGKDNKSEIRTSHIFLFKTKQTKLSPKDKENPEARWVEKEKVAKLLTHKKDKGFFLRHIKEIKI